MEQKLIKRELLRKIPDTYLAEYLETYSDGTRAVWVMSYLWDESAESLCRWRVNS
jgi:hypothetical protein